MENVKRPIGLTIFATLNFIYAVFLLFFTTFFMARLLYADLKMYESYPSNFLMTISFIIISLIPPILLIISGIGFLKMRWGLGYKTGNYAGIVLLLVGGALLYGALFAAAMSGRADFFSESAVLLPFLYFVVFYPLFLLLFLNLRYKKYFEISRKK